MQMSLWVKSACAFVMAVALVPAVAQATLFDFENIPDKTPLPFSDTVNGLTANFSGQASVCTTGAFFTTLMGNTSVQQFCNNPVNGDQTGPLRISFSSDLSSVSFNFATFGGDSTLTVQALENGNPVSTSTFNAGIPPGQLVDEGFASISGTFNMLVLTADGGASLAIDNISTPAVPEPASIAVLGAALAGLILVRRRFVDKYGLPTAAHFD
jgi:PEP-CTERM motif